MLHSMDTSSTVSVDLGDMRERVEALVASGAYTSVGDVLRAGLHALNREEAARNATLRERVQEALDDHRPPIPASQVFAELRAHHQVRLKAASRAG